MRVFAAIPWILFAGALVACSKKSPEPKAAANGTKADTKVEANVPVPGPEGHGTRRLRGLDLPVYVDGAQAAVLRYGDLPAIANVGAEFAPTFRLADYLAAIGVPASRVRAVFFYDGSNRIASVQGKELAKGKDRFLFQFASGKTGIAETAWDTVGLENSFIVHEIRKIAVFVGSDAPALDKNRQCLLTKDGECSGDVPQQVAEPAKGTRIYVDGKMAGYVKRRNVGDALVIGDGPDGERAYSLAKLVRALGVDTSGVTAVEMVAGDDVVGSGDGVLWARHESELSFSMPKHQHGKIRVRVPADMQAAGNKGDQDASVTSVLLYKSTAPASGREVVAISEATDLSTQLASNDEPRDEEKVAKSR